MAFTVISGGFPMLFVSISWYNVNVSIYKCIIRTYNFGILESQLQSGVLIPQFISMALGALQRMFITAWAADDLREIVSCSKR